MQVGLGFLTLVSGMVWVGGSFFHTFVLDYTPKSPLTGLNLVLFPALALTLWCALGYAHSPDRTVQRLRWLLLMGTLLHLAGLVGYVFRVALGALLLPISVLVLVPVSALLVSVQSLRVLS